MSLLKNILLPMACFLACCTFTCAPKLEAAVLHAIIVGDNYDPDIGEGVDVDINDFYFLAHFAAYKAGMTPNIVVLCGKEAKRHLFLKTLNTLKVNPDDTVITFFGMHGYRFNDKKSLWPNLYFQNSKNGLELDYVIKAVKKKNPRLHIALADVCNTAVSKNEIPTIKAQAFSLNWVSSNTEKNNYRKLFAQTKGTIIAAAAIPGDTAWGNETYGGYFTSSFIYLVKEIARFGDSDAVSWESIFAQINDQISFFNVNQTSLYELEIE